MSTVLDPIAPIGPNVTPRVRTAWRVAASAAAVLLVAFGLSQTVSALAHGERDLTRTFPAAGIAVVELDVESGSAEIVASDTDEITVTAHIDDGLRATAHSQEVVGDRLVLGGSCPLVLSTFCDVRYRVELPADIAVVARMEDGSLLVEGTTGPVDASSENGGIQLVGVAGDLRIQSDNGSLRGDDMGSGTVVAGSDNGSIDLAFTDAPDTVSAVSDNGSVTLRLPEVTGAYRVEMETDNGSTELGVATDPASARRIRAFSDNGYVRVVGIDASDR